MAKKVAFKKKPVKTPETEVKLDQWLEQKAKEPLDEKTAPVQPPIETAPETQAAPEETRAESENEKPSAPTNNNDKAPLTASDDAVSFDEQEEQIEVAQVTFHMPKTLQRRLKFECFKQDKTIKDYVIELLDKKLPKETPF